MFLRCTIYEIWINSLCRFGVNRTFYYVVCEHLHNLEEGAQRLTVFCFRVESLIYMYKFWASFQMAGHFSSKLPPLYISLSVIANKPKNVPSGGCASPYKLADLKWKWTHKDQSIWQKSCFSGHYWETDKFLCKLGETFLKNNKWVTH